MNFARGIFRQRIDNKGRLFVKQQMRPYFGLPDGEKSGANCNIGISKDNELPVLVFINDTLANEEAEKIRQKSPESFDDVRIESMKSPDKRSYQNLRPVAIKSNKIQLIKFELDRLNLRAGDNKVVVHGDIDRYIVWPEIFYKREFPELYERFVCTEADDD